MMNKKVEDALNIHLNSEMYSAYLYLSMSAWVNSKNLPGFTNWMKVQYDEEIFHSMKMFDYINERGGKVQLQEIKAPKTEWKDIIEVFEYTYEHETMVTTRIYNLADIAYEAKDHATSNFLQWYISEQVEEESNVQAMLEQLKLIEGRGAGLFMLDREALARVFTPPV